MSEKLENTEVETTEEAKPNVLVRSFNKTKTVLTSTKGKVALAVVATTGAAFATYKFGFGRGVDVVMDEIRDLSDSYEENDENLDAADSVSDEEIESPYSTEE